jgi:hypothetical protein
MGFFSPGSYWPFGLAASAAFVGLSLGFWYIPMLVVAVVVLLLMVAGLVFEYHIRPSEH